MELQDWSLLGDNSPERSGRRVMRIRVVLEPSEEGGYTVFVPALPGCISEGETKEEALRNIREAIELYLEPTEDEVVGRERAEVLEIAV